MPNFLGCLPDVSQSLRIGLLLKCYVRSLDLASDQVTLSLVSSELRVGGYAALCDVLGYLVDRATNKQCSVLFYLLKGYSQKKIAQAIGLEPSTVSQHAAALGRGAIQRALAKFEKENFNQERISK